MKVVFAAALLVLATLPAMAQEPGADKCVTADQFVASAGNFKHIAVTGDELAAYIDGFNAVTGGHQEKDDFNRLEIFLLDPEHVGWAFFKDGCFQGNTVVPSKLNAAIVKWMHSSI